MSIHISSTDIYDALSSYWGIIGPHVLTVIIIFIIIGSILNIIAESDLADGEINTNSGYWYSINGIFRYYCIISFFLLRYLGKSSGKRLGKSSRSSSKKL